MLTERTTDTNSPQMAPTTTRKMRNTALTHRASRMLGRPRDDKIGATERRDAKKIEHAR